MQVPNPAIPQESEMELYRYYDADGGLLYVGISRDSKSRLVAHKAADVSWAGLIARTTIERFASRSEARAAELNAIATERPRYNISDRPPPSSRTPAHEGTISGDELRARIKRWGLTYERAAERLGLSLDGLNKQMRGDHRVSHQTAIILRMLELQPGLSQEGRWAAERQMERLRNQPAEQEFGLDGELLPPEQPRARHDATRRRQPTEKTRPRQ